MVKKLLARLKEASSWAGFAVIGGVFGLNAEESSLIWTAISAVSAVVAIFLPEKGEKNPEG